MRKLTMIIALISMVTGCDWCDDKVVYEKWPGGIIKFYLDSSCSDYEKRQFRLRAQEWDKTNIKFIESDVSGDYICSVYKSDTSSVSGFGKHKDCWIEYKDFNDRINLLHEQTHLVLGAHPHQQPNRDLYVRIFWDNVLEDQKDHFKILPAYKFPYDYTNFEYDYNSCLHYQGWEFSKNENKTIESITDTGIFSVGISSIDIEKVNTIYKEKK